MTPDDKSREAFGCLRCWPEAAGAAWAARPQLRHVDELVDEPHFHVMILACPQCAQRFLSVFTELIDWADGDDPQFWTLLPLTSAEAAGLLEQRDALTECTLQSLGPARRALRHACPKGGTPQTAWQTGLTIGPHD